MAGRRATAGRAFCALVAACDGAALDFEATAGDHAPGGPAAPARRRRAAFAAAAARFGVAPLLDADDDECCDDEQSVLTYLGEVCDSVSYYEN